MNLTIKRIGALTLAVCLLLVAGWYLALFRPQQASLKKASAAKAAAEAQVTTLQGQVYSLEALVKQIPNDQKEMAALKTAIPDNADLADVLGQLHAIANNTHVTLGTVSPSTPQTTGTVTGGPPSITLSLAITGSYAQTISFIDALVALPRALTIKDLSVSGTSANLSTSMTAIIFYANATETSGASSSIVGSEATP